MNDPIVEETRRIRDEYAKSFGYDLKAIVADLQRREARSDRKVLPPAQTVKSPAA